ncbi:MAG: type II toxin-antitoxin system RelE/ParE family toxin [Deltaproteobacteria bacterium]|nr:type II toxin-antitoxin system RelE/ParE family toxin [Deltaproteobacteria bacterium]
MVFELHLTKVIQKDFDRIPQICFEKISKEILKLKQNPFPEKKRIKRIKGTKLPLYHLRVDTPNDSYRIFYFVERPNVILLLRAVSKKTADRVIRSILN